MHIRHILVVVASLLLSFALVGCDNDEPVSDQQLATYARAARSQADTILNDAKVGCRDGVEYLVYERGPYIAITPHIKWTARPYTC